jgi:3-deoxy-manno-octulosonate cytidylyltransferase (CMP-KDO synthetase)
MISKDQVTCFIPARFNSSRLPGKLLHTLGKSTVIENVYNVAVSSDLFNEVFIVSGDKKISDYCRLRGLNYIECLEDFNSGSERVISAAKKLKLSNWIVNLQGDQPFTTFNDFKSLLSLSHAQAATTLIVPRTNDTSHGSVYVSINDKSEIVTFSRRNIPSGHSKFMYHTHIGLYLYPKYVWGQTNLFHNCPWSITESLEQLNLICKGIKILAATSIRNRIEINTQYDLDLARKLMNDF